MHLKLLFEESEQFLKLAKEIFVYVFVPIESLPSIKEKGLLSASELIKDSKVLKLTKGPEAGDFTKQVKKDLADPEWKTIREGVSAFFTLPDWSKLSPKHIIFKKRLVPILVNLSKLQESESVKFFGVEMEAYDPKKKTQPKRERFLSFSEVKKLTDASPSELWKYYDNPRNDKYAPEVPHVIILTKSNKIKSKYLSI